MQDVGFGFVVHYQKGTTNFSREDLWVCSFDIGDPKRSNMILSSASGMEGENHAEKK